MMRTPVLLLFTALLFAPVRLTAQLDSGYVKTQQPFIFYRIWGTGEPLVFINGGPGFDSWGYRAYAEALSHGRQVILYDQRGTGKSIREDFSPPKYYMSQFTDDLEALREHLGFEQWQVMGHSFGGSVALNYAAKYPERVSKLILSATPKLQETFEEGYQTFKTPAFAQLTLAEQQIFLALQEEKARDEPDQLYIRKLDQALKGRFYVSKPENYATVAVWFLNYTRPRAPGYALIRSRNSQLRVMRKLKKFEAPVLIIHGVGDFLNIAHPIRNQEIFSNVQLEILPDSGHMMLLDQPKEYIRKIEAFLAK